MRHHPLTPMGDANLVRVLGRQMRSPVALVELATVEAGPRAVAARFAELADAGHAVAIVDAVFDRHLDVVAEASAGLRLTTGGAAFGGALARVNYRPGDPRENDRNVCVRTPIAMLSGSCSATTLSQVERAADLMPTREVDPMKIAGNPAELPHLIDWACDQVAAGSVLLYSSGEPAKVRSVQQRLGQTTAAGLVEQSFGSLAVALADRGVRTFVVAGGETSAAVLQALGIRVLTFGDELDPGVPWARSLDPDGYVFALKSGNFGSRNFFAKALERAR
jgi:uncharacterized protein YgbK (DUF1537 family)